MIITASTLRGDIYRLLDRILESGEPLEVVRNGRTLRIVPDQPPSRLARLLRRDVITGDPDDLVEMDWTGEWNPGL